MHRILSLLLTGLLVHTMAVETTLAVYDPLVVQADGKDISVLMDGTITGSLTFRGKSAGDLTISLAKNGMMQVKGLEKHGIKGPIPYKAVASSNGLKAKFPSMRYSISSNLPEKDGQRAPLNLSFFIQLSEKHKSLKSFKVSSNTVAFDRGSDTVSMDFDGNWTPTAIVLAPEAATPPAKAGKPGK
jgi:hypothetical protein